MASTPTQALLPGTLLDSFRVDSVLGVGGFGITYAAFDQTLQCPVAIKEYFPSNLAARTESRTTIVPTSDEGRKTYEYGLRRFLQEARTLAQFHEPNIVRVRNFIEANGTAYLVMDYEDGRSLGKVLSDCKRLTSEQTRGVALDCLRGLRAMHAQNYLHRDIKPDNIFLRKTGVAALLDFGAARIALKNQESHMTIILTPGYAPAEQYSRDEQQGPWTDLYAMGATLYHCIVGQAPPASTERLSAIARGKPDAAAEWLDAVEGRTDPTVMSAVRWMVQPHADDRPQHADAVFSLLLGSAGEQRTLMRDLASDTDDDAQSAPTVSDGSSLDSTFRVAPSTSGVSSGSDGDDSRGPPGTLIDAGRLASAQKSLAAILGPIAEVLVQRAAQNARSLEDFYHLVANELEDETERKRFLNSLEF
jgi:serine/threonine protein kinase